MKHPNRSLLAEYGAGAALLMVVLAILLYRGVDVMDSGKFLARGHCGYWDTFALNLYITSNLLIFFAYSAIAACLTVDSGRPARPLAPSDHAALRFVFGVFILACGISHLEGVLSFWWPAYHWFTITHTATAIVSWLAFFRIFQHRMQSLSVL